MEGFGPCSVSAVIGLIEPLGLQCHGTIGRELGVERACTRLRVFAVKIR